MFLHPQVVQIHLIMHSLSHRCLGCWNYRATGVCREHLGRNLSAPCIPPMLSGHLRGRSHGHSLWLTDAATDKSWDLRGQGRQHVYTEPMGLLQQTPPPCLWRLQGRVLSTPVRKRYFPGCWTKTANPNSHQKTSGRVSGLTCTNIAEHTGHCR